MKLNICQFFGHRWNYSTSEESFCPDRSKLFNLSGTLVLSPSIHSPIGHPVLFSTDTNGDIIPIKYLKHSRICKRCNFKQFETKGRNFSKTDVWVEDELSKEDIRSIKLKS